LSEIAKYYDDSLRTIFEPIDESMMKVIGLGLPTNGKNNRRP
jgi:hypothetical protein